MKKINQFINQFFIKFFCQKVGYDEFQNQYFLSKDKKRFIVYNGICEPTKVPAQWHGWLHYTYDKIPIDINRHSWQKIHIPNLTGTKNAFNPKNQPSSKSNHDFVAWNPNQEN